MKSKSTDYWIVGLATAGGLSLLAWNTFVEGYDECRFSNRAGDDTEMSLDITDSHYERETGTYVVDAHYDGLNEGLLVEGEQPFWESFAFQGLTIRYNVGDDTVFVVDGEGEEYSTEILRNDFEDGSYNYKATFEELGVEIGVLNYGQERERPPRISVREIDTDGPWGDFQYLGVYAYDNTYTSDAIHVKSENSLMNPANTFTFLNCNRHEDMGFGTGDLDVEASDIQAFEINFD